MDKKDGPNPQGKSTGPRSGSKEDNRSVKFIDGARDLYCLYFINV